jgi:WD40 repeat protein
VRGVAFSPDGAWLASGGTDRSVRLHDLVNGGSRTFPVPTSVNHVAVSCDGRTLAAVGDAPESAVRLWELETGQETTLPGHTGNVLGVEFSPATPLLATCGGDGTVRLWNIGKDEGERTKDENEKHPRSSFMLHASSFRTIGPGLFGGAVRAVAFTPDGRYLATANANGTVYLLRVEPPSQ